MLSGDPDWKILSEDEKSLIAFFRSQPPRVKEILMNITRYEKGLCSDESAEQRPGSVIVGEISEK